MKKILLFLALVIFIGCSLDTFKSENLASWSINLDIPLFRTDYTVGEMLKDYDELEVEYYDQNDSIYVFYTSTPHYIDVRDYVIEKDGNNIIPEIVNVPKYELDIPTLPSELDGINFVDIDLYIDIDLSQFRTDLAETVVVDSLIIKGENEDGITATAYILNQDIWSNQELVNNGILEVENPEDLINIRPTKVELSGQITVYPTDDAGRQVFDQVVLLTSILHAPLILEITETATFSTPPEKVNIDIDNELIESLKIFAEIDNQMEIGGKLQVLVTPDTMNFEQNSLIIPDTLLTLQLIPEQSQVETIELGSDKFDLFADSTYMKILINIIGNADSTRFFTNDSIKVLLYSSAEVLIDPQNMGEEE